MRIRASGKDLAELKVDLAVCFAFDNDKGPRGVVDVRLRQELARQMKEEKFKARPGDRLVWNTNGPFPSRRFLVVGLGPEKKGAPGESLRAGCAAAVRAAASFSADSMGVRLPPAGESPGEEARAATEGVILGAYQFDRYLTDPSRLQTRLTSVEISAEGFPASLRKAVKLAEVGGNAICLARDLVNEGPSRLTPQAMARQAEKAAKASGLRCKVHGPAEIKKLGLHALMAVGRGSREPSRVVHLVYRPPGSRRAGAKKVLLVGKGVTFDSGGLNLKPVEGMLAMKMDMAGAATVLAAMSALAGVGCSVEVHGLLGLVENMTGGAAYKPGDFLETHAGKIVEVGNTDAEGRLVLCDLLSYGSSNLKPTQVVDVATLTGACVVALGLRATGLFTRHEPIRDALCKAGAVAGEKIWPLPMYDEYLQLLQKGPADLNNIGGRWGGAITAALFLGEFVPRDLPWAHLDIAGPAFTETELPDSPVGATGACVLTLLRWLEGA